MAVPRTRATNAVLLRWLGDMLLGDDFAAELTAYASAMNEAWVPLQRSSAPAVPVRLPRPATVSYGSLEDRPGVLPQVGLYVEGDASIAYPSSQYTRTLIVAVTAALAESNLGGGSGRSLVYTGAQAYVECVCAWLAQEAMARGVPMGVYDAQVMSTAGEQSQYVAWTRPQQDYTIRHAAGRVALQQSIWRSS